MAIRTPTALDLTILIGTMLIWALAFIGMKVAVPETGPFWLAAVRSALGFLVVLPVTLWLGLRLPTGRGDWIRVTVVALLNLTIPVVLISWAELTLDAGIAALLMGTGPFLALFVGHLVTTDERFTIHRVIAVFMGFFGILSIVGVDALKQVGSQHLMAQMALIAASACYVTAGFTIRRIDMPPLSLTTVALALSTLMLIPLSLLVSGPFPTALSSDALLWLLFLGVISTGLAFVARFYLIQTIGYSMFALGVNLIPVFGVMLGALILGEVITLRTALALCLVVGGLFVARLGATPKTA